MKICLNIKKLKGQFKSKEAIKLAFKVVILRTKIGEQSKVETQISHYRDGSYAFMQKHYLHIPQKQNVPFVEIQIQAQSGEVLYFITVFYVKFKQFTNISINNKHSRCVLHYEVKESSETNGNHNDSTETQKSQIFDDEHGKLEIFNLGLILINFAQRIDIVVYIWKKMTFFLLWKNATTTIFVTLFLTLFIYYIKISILISGALLYFCKDIIMRKFERIHKYDTVKGRILFPKQNALFLQTFLTWYIQLYESISQIIFNHDKTFLINIIQLVCKMGLVNILMLFFFDLQHILIISLWAVVLFGSPAKKIITGHIKQFIFTLLGQYFKIVDKISNGINDVIKKSFSINEDEHFREFYFYEYEYWSLFEGWSKDKRMLSDESFECIGQMKQTAPEGWAWSTVWKIDYDGDVDDEGFQYEGKFTGAFTSSAALSTCRRRKWKRLCIKNPYEGDT